MIQFNVRSKPIRTIHHCSVRAWGGPSSYCRIFRQRPSTGKIFKINIQIQHSRFRWKNLFSPLMRHDLTILQWTRTLHCSYSSWCPLDGSSNIIVLTNFMDPLSQPIASYLKPHRTWPGFQRASSPSAYIGWTASRECSLCPWKRSPLPTSHPGN